MHPEGRPHVFISSPRLTLAKLHESFMEPPPQPLHSPLSSWVVRRAMSIVALSYLQRCWTTSAVNSVPGSLRRDRGIPNVNSNSTNFLATFSASCWVVDRRTGICWLSSTLQQGGVCSQLPTSLPCRGCPSREFPRLEETGW